MVDIAFHHGTRVFENLDTPVVIRTAQSAVIFLSGTAPDADANEFPIDRPRLIKGAQNYSVAKKLGRTGSLPLALDAILDQGGRSKLGAYVYIHRVTEEAQRAATISNIVGDRATMTGIHSVMKIPTFGVQEHYKPRIFIAPGWTGSLATDGVSVVNITDRGGGYAEAPAVVFSGGGGGRGAEGYAVLVEGEVDRVILTKYGFGYTEPPDVAFVGGGGAGATGEATIGTVGNPIAHEYEGLAAQLRAVAFIDGPSTDDDEAVLTRERYGSDRLYMCDPYLMAWDTTLNTYVPQAASARFAGVQCRVDRDIGFYKSVSNSLIYGIDGPSRPINYGDQTDYLNENLVGTVIHRNGGWWTWGNRTTSGMFLAVRRTRDFVNEAIENAWMDFVDRPMNEANLKAIAESGTQFLKMLEAEGYVMQGSGRVWYDRDRNQPLYMQDGILTVNVQFETPPPIEDLRIETFRNLDAYTILLDKVRGAIETGPLAVAA